jgi:uncharacterized protein
MATAVIPLGEAARVVRRADAETIVSLFRHIDAREWSRVEKLFSEDIVYERPGYPRFRGRPRVMHFYRRERVITSGQHELHRIVVRGSVAVCWGRFRGNRKNGMPVDIRFADVYRFDEGRIKHRTSYFFVPAV